MAVTKKPLPKKHNTSITRKAIEELAAQGMSKKLILDNLNLPVNFFGHHIEPDAWFNFGRSEFAKQILEQTKETVQHNASTQKYLLEKMQVFRNEILLPKMSDAKSAAKVLSHALDLYARKEISDIELQTIRAAASVYSELCVNTDLALRVEKIEELLSGRNNG